MSSRPAPSVVVRRSPVHGRGLFANRDLPAGHRLIRYRGRVLTWDEVAEADGSGVTYLFDIDGTHVIDGAQDGNSARFANHSCRPNCEAIDEDGQIWFHTRRAVRRGDELTIDYCLQVDDPDDPELRELYACRCGVRGCRGTMLAPPD